MLFIRMDKKILSQIMSELGKKGGASKSKRKIEAARRNGAKNKPKKKR